MSRPSATANPFFLIFSSASFLSLYLSDPLPSAAGAADRKPFQKLAAPKAAKRSYYITGPQKIQFFLQSSLKNTCIFPDFCYNRYAFTDFKVVRILLEVMFTK
jgi:hypothetical protein